MFKCLVTTFAFIFLLYYYLRVDSGYFVTKTVIRWVNIGKERDGMTPDAVQYARALMPPYHLLSYLRLSIHQHIGLLKQRSLIGASIILRLFEEKAFFNLWKLPAYIFINLYRTFETGIADPKMVFYFGS